MGEVFPQRIVLFLMPLPVFLLCLETVSFPAVLGGRWTNLLAVGGRSRILRPSWRSLLAILGLLKDRLKFSQLEHLGGLEALLLRGPREDGMIRA